MVRRRRIITASVAALTASLAGCGRESSSNEVVVEFVEILNLHEADHTLTVEVEKDRDIVADETVELAGLSGGKYDSVSLDGEWLDTTGDFVVRARFTDADTWREVNLPGSEEASVGVEVMIENDGSLGIFTAR